MRTASNYGAPQRILVCNRTGAALGRNVKLDGAYWRRHARQPVEFAKSVRTLADLNCKVLLEIGPQPVLTAAALRAWPDPATTPRAIASLRRNTADHRQITEALADAYVAGHLPDFGALLQAHARKLDLPTYPFEHRQYWYLDNRERPNQQQHVGGPRTEAVRLLEDGRIEELAALIDGASGDDQTLRRADQACGTTQSAARRRSPSRTTATSSAGRNPLRRRRSGAGCRQLDPRRRPHRCDRSHSSTLLTARGHRHRIVGLPDPTPTRKRSQMTLRAAAADDPTLRIVHVAALDADTAPSMQSLLRMQHRILGGTRRLFRAALAAELRRPVWVVTRGAQRVTDTDTVSPDQSCLWGFGRAAALELPQVWGGLADLGDGTADEWSLFIDRITTSDDAAVKEDQIALRDHAVYVPRLVRRTAQPTGTPLELRDDATYLVTGGLGSIGLEIAGYLAAQGAEHLVLTSRRAPTEADPASASTHWASSTAATSASSPPMSPMRTTSRAFWQACRPTCRRWRG